ncbi:hypothetical protein H5410_022681 [Solanum commersonii]|uniref:Uncharacterized protein n=1 Tax=Solanum commersonii TaxID=4109 RepID=A0A9J5ZHX2_SOLCO|nr:hypothetical protein H5410_022681 [Solanum commersonii]
MHWPGWVFALRSMQRSVIGGIELRYYIKFMKKLGREYLDGLLYHSFKLWSKRYFKRHSMQIRFC